MHVISALENTSISWKNSIVIESEKNDPGGSGNNSYSAATGRRITTRGDSKSTTGLGDLTMADGQNPDGILENASEPKANRWAGGSMSQGGNFDPSMFINGPNSAAALGLQPFSEPALPLFGWDFEVMGIAIMTSSGAGDGASGVNHDLLGISIS